MRKLLLQRFFQSETDFNDPSHSHYALFKDDDKKIGPVRRTLMNFLPWHLTYSDEEKRQRSKEYAEWKRPLWVSRFVDRLVRFAIAITGGVFLAVPMIIMTLDLRRPRAW